VLCKWGLVASIEIEVGVVKRRVPLLAWGRVAGRPEMTLEAQSLACGTEMCVTRHVPSYITRLLKVLPSYVLGTILSNTFAKGTYHPTSHSH